MNENAETPKRYADLTGMHFGRWTVLRLDGRLNSGKLAWLCQCECGRTGRVAAYALQHGKSLSCGCLAIDKTRALSTTHGATAGRKPSRLHRIWTNMKMRCNNPNVKCYRWYGAKGVTVCQEWANSFDAFRAWALSNGYADGLTIDRIDPLIGYEPDNCQWISLKQNSARADHSGSGRKRVHFADAASLDGLRRMLDAGMSAKGIAQKLGCPINQVWYACHRAGIPRVKWGEVERRKAARAECIRGLWSVGASPAIIHKALGFSLDYVRNVVKTLEHNAA